MHLSYAIVFVSDMARSVRFYRDVLGLPLRFETTHWTEFATGEATLALHAADSPAEPHADPDHLPAASCRPGFRVDDLDAFHKRMVDQGVPCVQPPREIFGARIALYLDPDGLGVSISETRRSGSAASKA